MTIRGPFAVIVLLLLFVSLAANFLVAGFVVARSNPAVAGANAANSEVDRVVALAAKSFPPEVQKAIADSTKTNRPQLRARLEAVQKARQAMYAAMSATPLDNAALDATFADYREAVNALQKAGQAVVAEAIASVPADVRRRIKPPAAPAPRPQAPVPAQPLPAT